MKDAARDENKRKKKADANAKKNAKAAIRRERRNKRKAAAAVKRADNQAKRAQKRADNARKARENAIERKKRKKERDAVVKILKKNYNEALDAEKTAIKGRKQKQKALPLSIRARMAAKRLAWLGAGVLTSASLSLFVLQAELPQALPAAMNATNTVSRGLNSTLFRHAQDEITRPEIQPAVQALKARFGAASFTDAQYDRMARQLMVLRAYTEQQDALDGVNGNQATLAVRNIWHAVQIGGAEAAQFVINHISGHKASLASAGASEKAHIIFGKLQPEDIVALAILADDDPKVGQAIDDWSMRIIQSRGVYSRGDSFQNRVEAEAIADLRGHQASYREEIDDPLANTEDLALEAADLALARALAANHATQDQVRDVLSHTYLFNAHESLSPNVARAIRLAGGFTIPGVKEPFSDVLILNVTRGESGWRASIAYFNKKTGQRGATGFGQMEPGTWVAMIKRYGLAMAKYLDSNGLADKAHEMRELVHKTHISGQHAEILAARTDITFNALCTQAYLQEARKVILHALPDNELAHYVAGSPEGLRLTLLTGASNMVSLIRNGRNGHFDRVMTPTQMKDNKSILKGTLGQRLDALKEQMISVPVGEMMINMGLKGKISDVVPVSSRRDRGDHMKKAELRGTTTHSHIDREIGRVKKIFTRIHRKSNPLREEARHPFRHHPHEAARHLKSEPHNG
ncbi:MAG: hypothetical protein KGI97_00215 [Alphaproteobacteria bacterium]|nr:hypothetical protein [Alphaproteobacteria bacterium]